MLPGTDNISCTAAGTYHGAGMLSGFSAEFTDVCFLGQLILFQILGFIPKRTWKSAPSLRDE